MFPWLPCLNKKVFHYIFELQTVEHKNNAMQTLERTNEKQVSILFSACKIVYAFARHCLRNHHSIYIGLFRDGNQFQVFPIECLNFQVCRWDPLRN